MIGETVSHYRILSRLGSGGMGVVYVAEDTHLARRVAIKFASSTLDDHQFRARFLREARAASALNHPHIAGIYDYGETASGQPFIVMELVEGEDLFHRLRHAEMSILQSVRIAEEVAEALGEAHRHGIVHRDIKPSNIVVNHRGRVKVLDFGLAKHFEAPQPLPTDADPTRLTSQTLQGMVLGTPQYMSPEQASDTQLGPQSDLFALGAVLYECLAGRPAFSGTNSVQVLAAVLHIDPLPASHFNPRVPPELDRIAAKALAKRVEDRYQTAEEMAADLHTARLSLTQPDTQETELLPTHRGTHAPAWSTAFKSLRTLAQRRSRTAVIAAIVLAAVVLVLSWVLFSARPYQPAPEALRWYQEGVTALRDGTYYKASKALEQAVTRDARFTMARARLAEAWLELDYSDKAREEMLRAAPPGTTLRLSRADRSYMEALQLTLTGDFASAAERYRQLAARAPDSVKADAYVDLGRALEKSEKLKDAMAAYQEAIRRQPQSPAAWLRLAILNARQLNQPKAAEAFTQAEQLYRGLSNLEGVTEVLYQRGYLSNRVGKVAEARALEGQALDLSSHTGSISQEVLALLQLSNIEHRANNLVQSQADATQAIELARANGMEGLTTRGLIDLGNAYFVKGEFDDARKFFEQGLDYARRFRSGRSEARALLSLGSLQIQTGQIDEGLANVRPALAWYQRGGYQKETSQALTLMTRAERQKGDYPAALKSFQQQLQIAQELGDQIQVSLAHQGIGSVLELEGRWPEALQEYRQECDAARHAGDQMSVAYCLVDTGEVLSRLGRYDEARQALEEAAAAGISAVQQRVESIRAEMALSQHPAPLSIASVSEAVAKAAKSGDPKKIADAALVDAETLLTAGNARQALERARSAQQWFAREEILEAQWRCLLLAARAETALHQTADSRADAEKASELLASLAQKWDSEDYKTYSARPDIQSLRGQLSRLAAAK